MLLLASLLLASAQGQTITLTLPPTPAPVVIKSIAEATGKRLAVAPVLADEVLFLRLKEAPVDNVLKHVAELLLAKWKKRTDGITWLEPDLDAMRKLDRAEADKVSRHLQDSLLYLRKRLAEQPEELDQRAVDAYIAKKRAQDEQISALEARSDFTHTFSGTSAKQESPAWRAVARITLQMDPKILLDIPGDGREVWAENPTPKQHAFSDEANKVLTAYRRELAIVDPTLAVKRIKLIFKKFSIASMFNVNLEAIGLDGKVVDQSVARLNSYADKIESANVKPDTVEPKPNQAFLQPSSEVVEARIAQALPVLYEGPERRAIVAKWRPRFLDPVHFEPLKWDLGEELVLAADDLDRNLVGTVNDVIGGPKDIFTKVTASQVLSQNRDGLLPSDDGWLLFRSHERMRRVSRSKAKSLIADCVRNGGLTVDMAAEWFSESTDRWAFMNWVQNYVSLLGTGGGRYGDFSSMAGDPDALRLWADIGSSGTNSLRNGGVIQLSRLSPAAKAKVEEMVFWGALEDGSDPTDRLPNGIADGTLTMSVEEKPVFYGWSSTDGPEVGPKPLDAKQFGALLAKGEPWKEIPAGAYQKYDRFRVGVHRQYTLNFLLSPGAIPMTAKLNETLFNHDAPDLSELPQDLKSAVEKARQEAITAPAEKPTKGVIPPR